MTATAADYASEQPKGTFADLADTIRFAMKLKNEFEKIDDPEAELSAELKEEIRAVVKWADESTPPRTDWSTEAQPPRIPSRIPVTVVIHSCRRKHPSRGRFPNGPH